VAHIVEEGNILARKPDGKNPLGRLGHRCEDNIKMLLKNRMGALGLYLSGST
jgi:hypothetical protein